MVGFIQKRILLASLSLLAAIIPSYALAAGVTISPLKFEYSIETSKEQSGKIKVTNNSEDAMTLYASKEDFIAGDEIGTPTFVKNKDKTSDQHTLSDWISLGEDHITLAKGESKEVQFSVKIPTGAEPGGHYGAIFFAPAAKDGSQVSVVQRIGALILVNVPGKVEISGNLTSFLSGNNKSNTFVEGSSFDTFPIQFETTFENEGNTHLKPTGKIEIYDEKGDLVTNVGREATYTTQGAYIGDALTDYIPVNDSLGNVLPKSTRKFTSNWEGIGYQVLNPDGSKSVKFKSLSDYFTEKAKEQRAGLAFYESIHTHTVNKPFRTVLSLSYEGKDKVKKDFKSEKTIYVSYEEQYVGINYILVVILLVILSGGIYWFAYALPKYRENLRKTIEKELSNKK